MADPVKAGLLNAYRLIMRPLVRILIRHGVNFGEFCEVLRSVFVESAKKDFIPSDRPNSTARIALLTGLPQEIVKQQEAFLASGELVPRGHLNQVTRILVEWHTDRNFTGPYGLPIELPLHSEDEIAFANLVERCAPETSPEIMLDELVRIKAVESTGGGKYKVLARAYIPDSLHIDGLERMGEVVKNFINTVETNMEKARRGAGRFERVVFADNGLQKDLLPEFDKLLRRKGQQLLVELDNWLGTQEASDNLTSGKLKTGVGIYHYVEDDRE